MNTEWAEVTEEIVRSVIFGYIFGEKNKIAINKNQACVTWEVVERNFKYFLCFIYLLKTAI